MPELNEGVWKARESCFFLPRAISTKTSLPGKAIMVCVKIRNNCLVKIKLSFPCNSNKAYLYRFIALNTRPAKCLRKRNCDHKRSSSIKFSARSNVRKQTLLNSRLASNYMKKIPFRSLNEIVPYEGIWS